MVRTIARLALATLAVVLLAAPPLPAATYVTPIIVPLPFSAGTATRVGTSENAGFSTVAGRVIFTSGSVQGSFSAPADQVNFAGVVQNWGPTSSLALAITGNYTFQPTVRSAGIPASGLVPAGVLSTSVNISSNATFNANSSFIIYGASAGPVFDAGWSPSGTSNDLAAGTGAGPVANPGFTGSTNFGLFDPSTTTTHTLTVANASTDADFSIPNPLVAVGTAADLTIKGITITGPDAASFTLDPADVAALLGTVLNPGDSLPLDVFFTPLGTWGPKTAFLNIYTDQFGELGEYNQVFSYQLNGVLAPEPASLAALVVGLGGLAAYRWRRRNR